MTTVTETTRTYTAVQQAARDYMQASKVVEAHKAEAKPHEAIMKAALDTLEATYPASQDHALATHNINGCWNVTLTFLARIDDSIKWAKVVEALKPHLDDAMVKTLDKIIVANTGTRKTRTLKA